MVSSITFIGFALSIILAQHQVLAYNQTVCCELAKNESQFISPIPDVQICGQSYNPTIPAAKPLFVNYDFCNSRCPGIGLSKPKELKQWAVPLMQFFLPAVVFSITIPRRKNIDLRSSFDLDKWSTNLTSWKMINGVVRLIAWCLYFVLILILVILDNVCWITSVIVGAGDMVVSGLYEAYMDYRIVKFVEDMGEALDELELSNKRELLVTVICGNLMLDKGFPLESVTRSITITGEDDPKVQNEKVKARLLHLLNAQPGFGSAIGGPVTFYLAAFLYTIIALQPQLGDEELAIALGFGIEWMVIVIVAIVSGCLLASNNPSTSASIVGAGHQELTRQPSILRGQTLHNSQFIDDSGMIPHQPQRSWHDYIFGNVYDTEFQPVTLWSRGNNKLHWIEKTQVFKSSDGKLKKLVGFTQYGWIFKVLLPSLTLCVLPPALAAAITYSTSPSGFGCRTLMCLGYAASQIFNTLLATRQCSLKKAFCDRSTGYRVISAMSWGLSFFCGVGGIFSQIIGLFRTCKCARSLSSWFKDNPPINLATDTKEARHGGHYWLIIGIVAIVFMMLVTFLGWWHQKSTRNKFIGIVQGMLNMETLEGAEVARRGDYSFEEEEEAIGNEDMKMSILRDRTRRATTPSRPNPALEKLLAEPQNSGS